MKKIICVLMSLILAVPLLAGCATAFAKTNSATDSGTKKAYTLKAGTKTTGSKRPGVSYNTQAMDEYALSAAATINRPVNFYGITFNVSPAWEELRVNSPLMKEYGVFRDDPASIISMEKGSLGAYINEEEIPGKGDSELLYLLFKNLADTDGVVKDITIGADTVNGRNFIKGFDYKRGSLTKFYMFVNNDTLYILNMETNNTDAAYMNKLMEGVAGSIVSNGNNAKAAQQNAVSNAANDNNAGQIYAPSLRVVSGNAYSKPATRREKSIYDAKRFLTSGVYTRFDLKKQLQRAGYTVAEAEYAAENCGANWAEEALRKANDYLESGLYNKADIKNALESIGFTSAEAAYAYRNMK